MKSIIVTFLIFHLPLLLYSQSDSLNASLLNYFESDHIKRINIEYGIPTFRTFYSIKKRAGNVINNYKKLIVFKENCETCNGGYVNLSFIIKDSIFSAGTQVGINKVKHFDTLQNKENKLLLHLRNSLNQDSFSILNQIHQFKSTGPTEQCCHITVFYYAILDENILETYSVEIPNFDYQNTLKKLNLE